MAIHLVPITVGAALASAAVYFLKDEDTRRRLADESRQFGHAIGDYVGGLFAGKEVARTEFDTEPEESAAGKGPDRQRCEALAKTGQRCRAKTNRVMNFPNTAGGEDEHGLCWRHAQILENGGPLQLADTAETEPEATTH